MHALKPDTKYKIVQVEVACPADLSDAEITDGLNEILRATIGTNVNAIHGFAPAKALHEQSPTLVADYRFVNTKDAADRIVNMVAARYGKSTAEDSKFVTVQVGDDPEEGEAFNVYDDAS